MRIGKGVFILIDDISSIFFKKPGLSEERDQPTGLASSDFLKKDKPCLLKKIKMLELKDESFSD